MEFMDLFKDLSIIDCQYSKLLGILAATIINKRVSEGLSQRQMSIKAEIPQSTLSNVEDCQTNLSVRQLIRLLESLCIPYSIKIGNNTISSDSKSE
jgi:transcriptional regulator with XRE-family HTH domain